VADYLLRHECRDLEVLLSLLHRLDLAALERDLGQLIDQAAERL
jgi:hypothetical protein